MTMYHSVRNVLMNCVLSNADVTATCAGIERSFTGTVESKSDNCKVGSAFQQCRQKSIGGKLQNRALHPH